MFKDIPLIKPSYQTSTTGPLEKLEEANPDYTGKRVWVLRVASEEALNQLMRFVGTHEGITDLKPRYKYNAEKQRAYRARKKAEEQLHSMRSEQEPSPPDLPVSDA